MPAAAENPLARTGGLRGVRDHLDDVVPVLRGRQLEVPRGFADTGEVDVRVDEAGRGERALEVDDRRVRADVALNLLIRAEGDDRIAARRQRLCLWLRLVDGD